MMFTSFSTVICFLTVFFHSITTSEVLRPRGVALSKVSLYIPDKDFTCFDGSLTVPFTYVNDDYCDCPDGSDEPGTPACPNGTFHCTNAGHRPQNIPSSRVNDGICDCCDTSDEYASQANCINNCNDLGKAARVEAQKLAELRKLGSEMRVELSKKGKQLRQEKQERLIQLEKDKEEAENLKKEKEALKQAAEELENKALEKYREAEEEEKKVKQEEERKALELEAFEHFQRLDSNQDGKLQISEIETQQTFDQNKDGIVSSDEVKTFFDSREELNWDDFLSVGWPRMRPLLMMNSGMFQPPAAETTEDKHPESEHDPQESAEELPTEEEGDGDDDDDDNHEEDDDEKYDHELYEQDAEAPDEDEQVIEDEQGDKTHESRKYNEETQQLIDDATKARSEFEEADRNLRDVMREIKQLQDSIEKDYGEDDEFAPLDGECFEFTDIEYVYKLCPFDHASQQSKGGGSETRLGTWNNWSGPDGNKYASMLYDKGQSCWNGPQRSAQVKLVCGTENSLRSVSEPNRCEYLFEFVTPAICQPNESSQHAHEEL